MHNSECPKYSRDIKTSKAQCLLSRLRWERQGRSEITSIDLRSHPKLVCSFSNSFRNQTYSSYIAPTPE